MYAYAFFRMAKANCAFVFFGAAEEMMRGSVKVKIIIIGCGKVGEELAAVLSQEDNDITIIDRNEQAMESLVERYDVMGTVGNGASFSVQQEAGIADADLMIAVTGSDEMNVLCCLIAKKAGNCHTIARIRNPEYNTELQYIKEELGLAMLINQELTAAREIARVIRFPSAIEIDTFAKGRVELLRFRIPQGSVLDGMSLIEMHSQLNCNVLVCTVERGGEILIPNGEYRLQSADIISIVSEVGEDEVFFKKIGLRQNRVRNVMIVGGGDIAFYLGQLLGTYGIRVKIIERDKARCELLWDRLPKASIIHGDGTSRSLLEEEDLENMDAFVTLTDIDEENVILSLYARRKGPRKIVTKINHISFDEVIDSLELDTVISPRNLTAEYILQYVRARKNSMGSNIETLHRIVDNRAEALELLINDSFGRVNIPLQDLHLKPGILMGCINRKGKIILPRGKDVLRSGDSVVVITTRKGIQIQDIEDIFETR